MNIKRTEEKANTHSLKKNHYSDVNLYLSEDSMLICNLEYCLKAMLQ